MASRLARSILACEMVAGVNIEQYSFSCPRRRRCTVHGLGFGWPLLFLSPSTTPEVTLPSSLPDPSPEGFLRIASSSQDTSGSRALEQGTVPLCEGR